MLINDSQLFGLVPIRASGGSGLVEPQPYSRASGSSPATAPGMIITKC